MPEVKIGTRTFRAEKMPATEATRNLIRLTKIIGPAMPALAGAVAGDTGPNALSAIASALIAADDKDLTSFIVELAEKAEVKEGAAYERVIYDVHFDDLLEAFQVVAFVLQVNYRDFFGGKLGTLINKASKGAA